MLVGRLFVRMKLFRRLGAVCLGDYIVCFSSVETLNVN